MNQNEIDIHWLAMIKYIYERNCVCVLFTTTNQTTWKAVEIGFIN